MSTMNTFGWLVLLLSLFTLSTWFFLQTDNAQKIPSPMQVEHLIDAEINLPVFRKATIIFYNRVPKCASTTTFQLINDVSKKNGFVYKRMKKFPLDYFYPDPKDFKKYVEAEFKDVLNKRAVLFEHLYFIDFTESKLFHNRTIPIYINLIRDPIARLQSHYYYIRFQPKHVRNITKDKRTRSFSACVRALDPECTHSNRIQSQLAFFCGSAPMCRLPGMGALQQAKRNVIQHYAVVGMTEQLRDFFVALEWTLPDWFKGITKHYDILDAKNSSVANKLVTIPHSRTLEPEIVDIMRKLLKEDYDFYHFIKQRFQFYMKHIKEDQNKQT